MVKIYLYFLLSPIFAHVKRDYTQARDMDEYIASFSEPIQESLEKIRNTIRDAAQGAEEAMRYGMPTFRLNGNLVHFAAQKTHFGFYPTPSGIEKFQKELSVYDVSKGTIRFPLDKPIPYDLIRKIVIFRVKEQLPK